MSITHKEDGTFWKDGVQVFRGDPVEPPREVILGIDWGAGDEHGEVRVIHFARTEGKSWMVQRLLALLAMEQARGLAHDLIWVDELPKEITLDSWANLGGPGSHQEALRRLDAIAPIPKALAPRNERSYEYARNAQEASRRHGNLAVLKAKAHRR